MSDWRVNVKGIAMMRDKMRVEGDKGGLVLKGKTVRFQVRASRTVSRLLFVNFLFFYLI